MRIKLWITFLPPSLTVLLQEVQTKDSGAPSKLWRENMKLGPNETLFSHFRFITQGPTLTLWFALTIDEERAQKNSCGVLILKKRQELIIFFRGDYFFLSGFFFSTKYCLEISRSNIQQVSVNNLLNSLDPDECRELMQFLQNVQKFSISDAWRLFKTWHRAELFQKIHETWEKLSKTPGNIIRTSVWWTENSVNLSGANVPNLEIKVSYRVKWAFLFLLRVQVAAHCWKWSCFQSLH